MSLTLHIAKETQLGRFLLDQVIIPPLPDFVNKKPY